MLRKVFHPKDFCEPSDGANWYRPARVRAIQARRDFADKLQSEGYAIWFKTEITPNRYSQYVVNYKKREEPQDG